MAKAKSKRQSSSQRHKVQKKIVEHKRDVRRAAKAMQAKGLKLRSKKSREELKLALRVSNANPDKAKILTGLIESRQAAKDDRAAKRAAAKEAKAGAKALRAKKGSKKGAEGSDDDDDADAEEHSGSDAESVGTVSDSSEAEGQEARLFKRSRAEFTIEGEKKLTSKQVAEREKQQRRQDMANAAKEKQQAAMSQHLLIPAGEHVGNPHLQFAKVVERLGAEIPAFAVVLDARCALQSVPWDHLDAVVASAVETRDELLAAEKARPSASSSSPVGKKKGRATATAEETKKAAAEAEQPQLTSASVQRLIMFVLNKADLVPADTLALAFSQVAEAVKSRYGDVLVPAVAPAFVNTGASAPSQACNKAAMKAATAPVSFTCLPHTAAVDHPAKIIIRALRQFHQDFVAAFDASRTSVNNMKGKLGVCVIGYPGVGKTALCRSLQRVGTDSVVATVPCRTIRTAVSKDAVIAAAKEPKIIIPSAKQLTLVTIADDEALKQAPIVAGDAIFHSESKLEKIKEPEAAALLLAEAFKDQTALCQALSLPVMPTAAAFLKSFGRCIIREKGFQPSGIFAGSAGSLSNSALTASDAMGAAQYVSGLKKVHVRRRHRDGRNPLRVGARIFLKEFQEGRNIVWAVKRSEADEAAAKQAHSAADVAAAVNLMLPFHIPKPVVTLLSATDDEVAAKQVAQNPGAVQLMVSQHALRDCIALLPHRSLEVDASAVVPPSLDESESDEEEEEEDSDDDVPEMDSNMSFEDEEGAGFSDLDDDDEEDDEEDDDEEEEA